MATRTAAAAQAQRNGAARPATPPASSAPADLGLLDRSRGVARAKRRQARVLIGLASACLAIPLVLAAVGHAIVASDQVRSDTLQTQIAQALQSQQDYQLQKAELVAPTRILTIAETHLHMVTPASVTYLSPVNPGETVAKAHQSGVAISALGEASAPSSTSHGRSKDSSGTGSAP